MAKQPSNIEYIVHTNEIKEFEVIVAEKFIKMCSESINPDLFVLLEEEIIPRLETARHIKIKRIKEQ